MLSKKYHTFGATNNLEIMKFGWSLLFTFLFSVHTAFGITSYNLQVPSSAGGTIGIAVKITIPDTARYACGAPITIWCKGGRDATSLSATYQTLSNWGVILIQFNYPEGGGGNQLSGGTYDFRGINCITAAKDVTRFGMGLLNDMTGHPLSYYCGNIVPLYNNVGFMGSSNGGNMSLVLAGMMGQYLPGLKWIHNWEAPLGDGIMTGDCGRDVYSPPHGNIEYNQVDGTYNWSTLHWDPNMFVEQDSLTGQIIIGGFYWDSNNNNTYDLGIDYYAHGIYWFNKYYISEQVINHAISQGIYPSNPPSHLPTANDAYTFWFDRNGYRWYDSVTAKFPNILFLASSRYDDHITITEDHPHIVTQVDSMIAAGCHFVRLNADRAYIELVAGAAEPTACDNNANQIYDHVNIQTHFQANGLLSNTEYKIAGILELCDRTMMGDLSLNLNSVIHVTCNQAPVVTLSQSPINCVNNIQLNANASPVSLYSYNWAPASGLSNTHIANPMASPNATTTYTVNVTNNITGLTTTSTITVVPYQTLNAVVTNTAANCGLNNGTASLVVTGGNMPYTILWSNGATSSTLTNLPSGNYSVNVTDGSGCLTNQSTTVASYTSCIAPVLGSVTNVNTTSVILNWSPVTCAVGYRVRYKISSNPTFINVIPSGTQTSYTLTGLTPGATYEWQVKTNCNVPQNIYSPNSASSYFTMGQNCALPTNLAATNITTNAATVSWNAISGATSYKVKIRIAGGTYTTVTVTGTSRTFTNLVSGATYEWAVKAICSSTSSSAYTLNNYFTTSSARLGEIVSDDYNYIIYPNPFTDQITINWDALGPEIYSVSLYNAIGQLVLENKTNITESDEYIIPTADFASGIYLLVILDKNGKHVFKLSH